MLAFSSSLTTDCHNLPQTGSVFLLQCDEGQCRSHHVTGTLVGARSVKRAPEGPDLSSTRLAGKSKPPLGSGGGGGRFQDKTDASSTSRLTTKSESRQRN
mmetsp:Transcript_34727/g.75009  ORF Transcript_34727/g.75009 Transcript_34727/m.75009 type:complete len:100 (+) Transcript_34727:258-557(+)